MNDIDDIRAELTDTELIVAGLHPDGDGFSTPEARYLAAKLAHERKLRREQAQMGRDCADLDRWST